MAAKKQLKKTVRQRELTHAARAIKNTDYYLDQKSTKEREAEIIRQFHQIQKGYTSLLTDVSKQLNLVKGWIGSQAMTKRNGLKARLSARFSRN